MSKELDFDLFMTGVGEGISNEEYEGFITNEEEWI